MRTSQHIGSIRQRQYGMKDGHQPTLAILFTSCSSVPIFVSGSDVFSTARVSFPVYTTRPTADPAARTVFAQSTFSTDRGNEVSDWTPGAVERRVRTP